MWICDYQLWAQSGHLVHIVDMLFNHTILHNSPLPNVSGPILSKGRCNVSSHKATLMWYCSTLMWYCSSSMWRLNFLKPSWSNMFNVNSYRLRISTQGWSASPPWRRNEAKIVWRYWRLGPWIHERWPRDLIRTDFGRKLSWYEEFTGFG